SNAASWHRSKSPSGRRQSPFIDSTRTSCSQRSCGQRVPEYHCIVSIEGDHLTRPKSMLSTVVHFTILGALLSCAAIPAHSATKTKHSGRAARVQTGLDVLEA